jgi:hypothetical protein
MNCDHAFCARASEPIGANARRTLTDCAARVAGTLALVARADAIRGRSGRLLDQWGDNAQRPDAIVARSSEFYAELREAVSACVDSMKSRGAPPEQVLIAIKGAVGGVARAALSRRDADALIDTTTKWMIDAYYAI